MTCTDSLPQIVVGCGVVSYSHLKLYGVYPVWGNLNDKVINSIVVFRQSMLSDGYTCHESLYY